MPTELGQDQFVQVEHINHQVRGWAQLMASMIMFSGYSNSFAYKKIRLSKILARKWANYVI